MPVVRPSGRARTDIWLSAEDRRVLDELKALTHTKTNTTVVRYLLWKAAIAAGINPPATTDIVLTDFEAQTRANKNKGNKSK